MRFFRNDKQTVSSRFTRIQDRKAKALNGNPFAEWVIGEVLNKKGSIDSCVGNAKLLNKYPPESIVCTKTIYNAVWSGNIKLTPFNIPEALLRRHKKKRIRNNKGIYGTSITERQEEIFAKIEKGHWEIDRCRKEPRTNAIIESSGDTSQRVFPLTCIPQSKSFTLRMK